MDGVKKEYFLVSYIPYKSDTLFESKETRVKFFLAIF